MNRSPIFIDLTNLVANPVRSGIHRVEREIISHWPGTAELVPCRFDGATGSFIEVPADRLQEIVDDDVDRPPTPLPLATRPIATDDLARGLFNPEVFYDQLRLNAYSNLCRAPQSGIKWLVYDFLPYLRPQDRSCRTTELLMPYLRALREVPQACFISEVARVDFIERVVRSPDRAGPVIPLGGDGLGTSKLKFDGGKRTFSLIGKIDPRQNVAAVLLAFEKLWHAGIDAPLTIIGQVDAQAPVEAAMIERMKGSKLFKHIDETTDEAVRNTLNESRATISMGSADGFGIRPFESLHAGVPIIALKGIPSLDLISPGGRLTIDEANPDLIENAARSLLDNRTAETLWDEAANLHIPTWKGFVKQLAKWLQGETGTMGPGEHNG